MLSEEMRKLMETVSGPINESEKTILVGHKLRQLDKWIDDRVDAGDVEALEQMISAVETVIPLYEDQDNW